MAFTQADKDQALADWQAVADSATTGLAHANALAVDTVDVAALQQQVADLTSANATLTQQVTDANAATAKANDKVTRIVAKMDAADAADVAEDQARADVRAIAAE